MTKTVVDTEWGYVYGP